ncbi:MAG: hypothetical protein RL757_419 [Bacteroidota bacterium]|jgi:iron complex outermembrane receptor protein
MRRFLLIFVCLFSKNLLFSQNLKPETDTLQLPTVDILATPPPTLATNRQPVTAVTLLQKVIQQNNFGQDLPYFLKNLPSVVETSDAGAGVGYTGFRVRGSDPTRINITVDGVPMNDAESQLVYFVNMPDFASSADAIQLQRGVGTSTNGAGAFGATLNILTNTNLKPRNLTYSSTFGSFNTFKNTLSASSGILKQHFYVDARLSAIQSDGYIDRAASKLYSAYLSAVYFDDFTTFKIKYFGGKEKTYQAWYGVPFQYINTKRTFNPAGTEKSGEPYDNETDNYTQHHLHAIFTHAISDKLKINFTGHYTRGGGYYEQYKANAQLSKYIPRFADSVKPDLTRQLWLENDFFGAFGSLTYKNDFTESVIGITTNRYVGNHFGNISGFPKEVEPLTRMEIKFPIEFYRSKSVKTEFSTFWKTTHRFAKVWTAYADLQYRKINYSLAGIDRRLRVLDRNGLNYDFFNPKIGFLRDYTGGGQFYGTFAVANREPNRNDFTDLERTVLPKPERLLNYEVGFRKKKSKYNIGINAYLMDYKNQLAITGRINDVGEAIRENVAKSYRAGVELEGGYQFKRVLMSGNLALSQNKIKNFTEFIDNWDAGAQVSYARGTTDLAMSPNLIGNLALQSPIFKSNTGGGALNGEISFKYVGKQFIDNTANANAALAAYWTSDLKLFYDFKMKWTKSSQLKMSVNNIFNQKYVNNAWVYRFISPSYDPTPDDATTRRESGQTYNSTGLFPQAGINVLATLTIGF